MTGTDFIFDLAIVALVAGITGLFCKRVGISVVVGYLTAGIIIGPYTPPFQLVHDAGRISMLADLGLVFLIFGIGLGFSIRRMQRLGPSLMLATMLGAIIVLAACRTAAQAMGFSDQQSLFVAGVLMVSSSAIIAKVLEELGANHTRWGQLALGVTLLEDIVAIVMLTLLASMTNLGAAADDSIWQTVSSFTGFVALVSLAVLMLVPRLLRGLKRVGTNELLMLLVTGLLLILGWLAIRLGYSLALTAFILGAIIGSTPQRPDIEQLFEGMRHLFGAVFFVAMGMLFNVGLVADFWLPLLAVALGAVLLRMPAMAAGLLVIGNNVRDSVRASVCLTPLGEFSFVIAFLGVQTGVMGESFYPAAVGAALLTSLAAPAMIRRADTIGDLAERHMPARITRGVTAWQRWLERMRLAREKSMAWRFIAPRVVQTLMQLLAVGGVLALAVPVHGALERWLGADLLVQNGTTIMFSLLVGLVLLPTLVAVWRNIEALSMIAADASTAGRRSRRMQPVIQRALMGTAATFGAVWLLILIPNDILPAAVLPGILLVLLLVSALLWRNLIRWQSRIEVHLQRELDAAREELHDDARQWSIPDFNAKADWRLNLREVTLPTTSRHAGNRLVDLQLRRQHGCSVVGIDRQGFAINNPSGGDRLFPHDRLLLLGTREDLDEASAFLAEFSDRPAWLQQFDDLATEFITLGPRSFCSGQTLRDLDLLNRYGIQIGGIRREGREIVSPKADETLLAGDQLLVVGTPGNIRRFLDEIAAGA